MGWRSGGECAECAREKGRHIFLQIMRTSARFALCLLSLLVCCFRPFLAGCATTPKPVRCYSKKLVRTAGARAPLELFDRPLRRRLSGARARASSRARRAEQSSSHGPERAELLRRGDAAAGRGHAGPADAARRARRARPGRAASGGAAAARSGAASAAAAAYGPAASENGPDAAVHGRGPGPRRPGHPRRERAPLRDGRSAPRPPDTPARLRAAGGEAPPRGRDHLPAERGDAAKPSPGIRDRLA